jgi:potassium-transporting ATPase ATP-binding subunit
MTTTLENDMEKSKHDRTIQVHFIPTVGTERDLAIVAILSAVPDHSPESHAIFSQALEITQQMRIPRNSQMIGPREEGDSFSGIDLADRKIRKGRLENIEAWLRQCGGVTHEGIQKIVAEIEGRGHQAFVVADQETDLGIIELVS